MCRCLWASFFFCAFGIMVWFIYDIYLDVSSYPFKTVSSKNMTSPLPFPAMTICNKNPQDLTKLPSPYDDFYRELLEFTYGLKDSSCK